MITARAITVTATTDTKTYDGTTSSAAIPTITTGTLAGTDTGAFTQTFDTANVGTGKTLTPAGSVSDGNGGANYAITFVNDTTGVDQPMGRHRHRRLGPGQDLRHPRPDPHLHRHRLAAAR